MQNEGGRRRGALQILRTDRIQHLSGLACLRMDHGGQGRSTEIPQPVPKLRVNSLTLYVSKCKLWVGIPTFKRRKMQINASTPTQNEGRKAGTHAKSPVWGVGEEKPP